MNSQLTKSINIPISDAEIRNLNIGDSVLLNGILITGRDAVHKWLVDCFIRNTRIPSEEDEKTYKNIQPVLEHGLIYHCGPVVSGIPEKRYHFVAAGPTTSIREEPYQAEIMRHLNLKGVIGKGGMGSRTLEACQSIPAVYFHAIGGAAALIAERVQKVIAVHKMEFGVPEAIWVIEVKDFPVIVTMDSHGKSLHDNVKQNSKTTLNQLL
jgi:fumarate hydratase subunit beta